MTFRTDSPIKYELGSGIDQYICLLVKKIAIKGILSKTSHPPKLKVKHQVKRWGSCSKDKIIRLNIQIIMAPMKQIQYVVAHELCHIKYKSHSSDFWKSLRLIMPDYELRKESLRKEGWRYAL